jgi:hypothetical protein
MIVIEVEIDQDKSNVKLMKKVLLVTALYAQVSHTREARQLVGEISLIDLAKALGVSDIDRLRSLAGKFDQMLADQDWTLMVDKKENQLTWRFCNCGKEGCEGHDL